MHQETPLSVTFIVPGEAKSERKRQRFVPGKGHVGKRTDTPDRAAKKAFVSLLANQQFAAPFVGPVSLTLEFRRPVPKSYPKRGPTAKYPWPWAWTAKPDATNLAKLIEDALNGIAWVDDAQVTDLIVRKRFGPVDEVEITVAAMTEAATLGLAPGEGGEQHE